MLLLDALCIVFRVFKYFLLIIHIKRDTHNNWYCNNVFFWCFLMVNKYVHCSIFQLFWSMYDHDHYMIIVNDILMHSIVWHSLLVLYTNIIWINWIKYCELRIKRNCRKFCRIDLKIQLLQHEISLFQINVVIMLSGKACALKFVLW